jgi:polysaccharide export outer membrane protein
MPDTDFTLLALLSQGGGVAQGLNNPQIRLHRHGRIYGTSVENLYAHPANDTTLRGGDKVIVQADTRAFLSLGAAGQEARHLFPKEHLTAIEALSIIGGVADFRADPKGVLILRHYPARSLRQKGDGPDNLRMVFTIDLTTADGLFSAGKFRILPGDLVYATEAPVTAARTILGLLGSAFGVYNVATQGN